ncbi:MAG: hypothetical protein EBR82_34440 [Caulobacteraceae bacterium]|nr:hypothetical protein [Microbacteriaceae bacterium]NBW13133.1 hypothetical protein [Caulobacteraceae bacterium]
MKTVKVPITTLETLIESLESAINVCYNVDSNNEDTEKSYPYATGYSRAAMLHIQEQLKSLKASVN